MTHWIDWAVHEKPQQKQTNIRRSWIINFQKSRNWLSDHLGPENVYYPFVRYASRKDAFLILTHLNPTFIQLNWALQGYTLFFLFLLKNINCGYSLEPHCRGGSNEYSNLCLEQNYGKYQNFYPKIFIFWP